MRVIQFPDLAHSSRVPCPFSRLPSTKMKVHPAICMKIKERRYSKWVLREKPAAEAPGMILFLAGEGGSMIPFLDFATTTRFPCPLSRVPSTKMKVHPAIYMKTKERRKCH